MHQQKHASIHPTLLQKIEHFCAYQERCVHDADQKLRSWKVLPDKIPGILKHLENERFIDEDRFARSFVRGKFHINKWGRIKIMFELRRRNIPEELIRSSIGEIGEADYLNTIRDMIIKKKTELSRENSLRIREKIITFVTGKGFEFNLTEKLLTELKFTHDCT